MDFQIVNEISSFWNTLVPSIFLGTILLILFLWVAGKENRELLMRRFSKKDEQYVLQKGIYIPRNQTTKETFVKELYKKVGVESFNPLVKVFIVVLLFFGASQILLQMFPPLLIFYNNQILYSSGVDNYTIARIWMHYPDVRSMGQLYFVILELTDGITSSSGTFIHAVEAFVRFGIVCSILTFFMIIFKRNKPKWANKKLIFRLVFLVIALMLILVGILFFNIQRINNETRQRTHMAYITLEGRRDNFTELSWEIQNIRIETFINRVEQDRSWHEANLYYGAFGIRNRPYEFITNVVREFYRFSTAQ